MKRSIIKRTLQATTAISLVFPVVMTVGCSSAQTRSLGQSKMLYPFSMELQREPLEVTPVVSEITRRDTLDADSVDADFDSPLRHDETTLPPIRGGGKLGFASHSSKSTADALHHHDSVVVAAPPTSATMAPIDESSTSSKSHQVEDLIQLALSTHPKIQAARSRVAASKFRIPQARALPDPMADSMFWPIEANAQQTASGRMTNQLSLSQTIPWTEKLRTQAAVAAKEVGMAQAEMLEIEREIAESVRLAYYEVWFADQAYRVVTENGVLLEQIVSITETRFRVGGSQQDVIRAELEIDKLEQQLLDLLKQKEVAQADVAALIQQPLNASIETQHDLPLRDVPNQLDTLLATAEQCNPALQNLAWQIQRDLQKQRLAALQKYPDLTYGFQYGWMTRNNALSPVADGIDNISFSVGTTLPIWKTKIRAGICEAAAGRASSTQLHYAEWNSIAGRLRRLFHEAQSLDQQRKLYIEKIIPRAEQALDISKSEYTVGKTTFIQMIDNFSEVLMFRIQVARIEASLAGVLAQIERTVGC